MLCEAMSENTDIPGLDSLVNTLTGESPSVPQTLASTFGETFGGSSGRPPFNRPPFSGSRPPQTSGTSILSTLENLIFGNRRSSPISRPIRRPPPPQRLRQVNPRRPGPRPLRPNSQPFITRRGDGAVFKPSALIRNKRQTRLQGNIIRLMQATGLDSLHAFPYVRAALI